MRPPAPIRRLVRTAQVPFDWRHPIVLIKMWRRGYPSPADFERIGTKATLAYIHRIGFDKQVTAALARHRAERQP